MTPMSQEAPVIDINSLVRRYGRTDAPPLPLRPVFCRFEDPEYSRRLASRTTRMTRTWQDAAKKGEAVTLAADRREYNPTTPVYVVFATDPPVAGVTGTLKVERVRGDQRDTLIQRPVVVRRLEEIALPQGGLLAGDVLRITLTATAGLTGDPIAAEVRIVADPVTPPPAAAYGLLRRSDGSRAVQCARFAWSPAPERIELVNPDDLLTEVTRRRAVFVWLDVVRCGVGAAHAVQKITAGGSTHHPDLFPAPGAS